MAIWRSEFVTAMPYIPVAPLLLGESWSGKKSIVIFEQNVPHGHPILVSYIVLKPDCWSDPEDATLFSHAVDGLQSRGRKTRLIPIII
jgi:hypothetical protein